MSDSGSVDDRDDPRSQEDICNDAKSDMLMVCPVESGTFVSERMAREEMRENARRIDRATSSVSRSVESLSRNNALTSGFGLSDILNSIEMEEKDIFTPIPDYILQDCGKTKVGGRLSTRETASTLDTVTTFHRNQNGRANHNASHRIVIDPTIPLPTVFDKRRQEVANSQRHEAPGNYHSLFFDDGEPVTFTPPENNKRKDLEKLREEDMYWKKKFQRPERTVELTPRKKMTVGSDFVPACAAVDHSLTQEKLRQRKQAEKSRVAKNINVA